MSQTNDTISLLKRGIELHYAKKYVEAEDHYKKVLKIDPNNYDAYRLLSVLAFNLEKYQIAETLALHAVKLNPKMKEAYLDLGNAQKGLAKLYPNKVHEAIENYNKALEIDPNYREALVNLILLFQTFNRYDEAKSHAAKLIELRPDDPHSYNTYGTVLHRAGDLSEAKVNFYKALELDPCFGQAYYNLSNIEKFKTEDEVIKKAKAQLKSNISIDNQIFIGFGLAQAYEDIGDYDQAFKHLAQANKLKKQSINYDIDANIKSMDAIKHFYSSDELKDQLAKQIPSQDSSTTPIFIVGMPRSGTTLTEEIISSHQDVFGAGEITNLVQCINEPEFTDKKYPHYLTNLEDSQRQALAQAYMDSISIYDPSSKFITNKLPTNFVYLGLIYMILPQAKIIHCKRDPIDTCLSCYKRLFTTGNFFSYDLEYLARYYKAYTKLMEFWQEILPDDHILEVNYEKLVENPETESERIYNYLGLDWDNKYLDFYKNKRVINTASASQVRQPIYKSAVKRWQKYEQHIGKLLDLQAESLT